MFIENKKGLSDIIATVLIVLLAIAAVVIVWSFISKFLYTGGGTIDVQRKCLEVDVKPIGCSNSIDTVTVKVQVLRGSPAEANAYLTLSDNSITVNKTTIPSEGIVDITFTKDTGNPAKSTKASAIVLDQDGKAVSCLESLVTVQCV